VREALPPASTGQRVLVVEDEPSVRALVASLLLGARYRVTIARNGEEALGLIDAEAEPFDLIVTDLMMPSIGGRRLAGLLEKRGSPSRLLFISGYANVTPAELLPHGQLLPKPFTPPQLMQAVRQALK
jgi:CheY-like chemotaxis protein